MTELERRTPAGTPEKTARQTRKPALRRRGPMNIAVIAMATGLIGTLAIPAYATTQSGVSSESKASTAQQRFVTTNAQSLVVEPAVAVTAAARDSYTTTLPVPVARVSSVHSAASRSAVAAGPGTAVNPGLPSFSLDGIFADGKQYIGVPYVYGGATPSGFDCSGFVLFLYSHVGVHLAHNARTQGQSGTRISQADARPGDLVIFYGGAHDGIYAGGNMVLDAPKPGGSVGIRPIWTSDVFFVRIGI